MTTAGWAPSRGDFVVTKCSPELGLTIDTQRFHVKKRQKGGGLIEVREIAKARRRAMNLYETGKNQEDSS